MRVDATTQLTRLTPATAPTGLTIGVGAVLFVVVVLAGGWMWLTGDLQPKPEVAKTDQVASARGGLAIDILNEAAERQAARTTRSSTHATPTMTSPDMSEVEAGRAIRGLDSAAADRLARGEALLAVGRPNLALPFLREAADLAPDSPDVHYQLGVAHLMRGAPGEAEAELYVLRSLDQSLASLLESMISSF